MYWTSASTSASGSSTFFIFTGGFFGITVNPKDVMILEAALEFGAALSVDFGVASGSVMNIPE